VDPSTVEQFLYFIYTGETMGTLANEELLKLADKYQLTTLTNLCQLALKKVEPFQMVNLVKNLNKEAEIPSSSKIR
jgi:ATP-dependent RNA circularization protein (DNA/RNA ligase family)